MKKPKRTRIEQLQIDALLAPILRAVNRPERVIKRVDASGRVVGTTTLGETIHAQAWRALMVEIEVLPGLRPSVIVCQTVKDAIAAEGLDAASRRFAVALAADEKGACKVLRKVPASGVAPTRCKRCAKRAYREATREKRRDYSRVWYAANQENEREKAREKKRARYTANPEKERERSRAWRAANPEKAREMERTHREANPEKMREMRRARREANAEKMRERDRAYREANREKLRDYGRVRYAANREKEREAQRARRARKKAEREAATTK